MIHFKMFFSLINLILHSINVVLSVCRNVNCEAQMEQQSFVGLERETPGSLCLTLQPIATGEHQIMLRIVHT